MTMIMSVVWLAFLAEFMMNSAGNITRSSVLSRAVPSLNCVTESCGCILEISEDMMGLTVTAAGTSLPNLFASVIVAKQGLVRLELS